MMVNRESLKARLLREEALKLKPYIDSVGKVTIGVGHNLTDNGISYRIAMLILDEDVEEVVNALSYRGVPWFTGLDPVRQQVCCDMAFNLGPDKFFGFTKMVKAIVAGDFLTAAKEMRASHWAQQVHGRAEHLALLMETGVE